MLKIVLTTSLVLVLGWAFATRLTIGTPFQAMPALQNRPGTVIVSLTEAQRNTSAGLEKVFWNYVNAVSQSLSGQPGFLGYRNRTMILGNKAWTMTVWEDEASLRAFVRSSTHQEAIREAWPAVSGFCYARVEVSASEVPLSWKRALRILEEQGVQHDNTGGGYYDG